MSNHDNPVHYYIIMAVSWQKTVEIALRAAVFVNCRPEAATVGLLHAHLVGLVAEKSQLD